MITRFKSVHNSRMFPVLRGVKQGGIISSIISIHVINLIFERWQEKMAHQRLLVDSDLNRLANFNCANDVLLYVKSLGKLQSMIRAIANRAASCKIDLIPGQSKILHISFENSDLHIDFINRNDEAIAILHLDRKGESLLLRQNFVITSKHRWRF